MNAANKLCKTYTDACLDILQLAFSWGDVGRQGRQPGSWFLNPKMPPKFETAIVIKVIEFK